MKDILATFAAIAILGISSGLQAQTNDYPGVWSSLTRAQDGLPGDSVLALTFDSKDSLWVGTHEGVAQRTPTGWSRYNSLTYMPSNDIWDMDQVNGSVWIGHRSGLTRFNGSTWTTHTITNSDLVNAPVHNLAHADNGDLWYGTARGLGRITSTNSWDSYLRATVPSMPYDGIEAITIDRSNNVWMTFIGTAGLVRFPAGNSLAAKYYKQDSIPGFPKGAIYIKALAVDREGNLWAGTARHGVVRINTAGATVFSKQTTPVIRNDTNTSLTVDDCGNVWVGSEGGAYRYNGTNWYAYSSGTGELPHDHVYTIKADRFGHVWIGTKGGVALFKPFPKIPVLLSPAMSAVIDTNRVICQWNGSCPGVLKYWYEIADNPQFANSKIDTTSASLMESTSATDSGLTRNTTYYWRVKALNDAGWSEFSNTWTFTVQSASVQKTEDAGYRLLASYPNPTSDRATIAFELPRYGYVNVMLFDAMGRSYSTGIEGRMGPGIFSVPIELSDLSAGGYICTLRADKVMLAQVLRIVR